MKNILILAALSLLAVGPASAQVAAFGVGGGAVITNSHSTP